MKSIVITAADENFSSFLNDWINALEQWGRNISYDIGILDVGLSRQTAEVISEKVDHLVIPDWDLPINEELRRQKPFLRAMTARPFLPKYFPDYDMYFWLDCDAWVQAEPSVETFFSAATDGRIGIVPQVHNSYVHHIGALKWRIHNLYRGFGLDAVEMYHSSVYHNSGAFSLKKDAVHWGIWADYFKTAILNDSSITDDQTALNYAIWKNQLPICALPAIFNWCCHLRMPEIHIDSHSKITLCEPNTQYIPIKIVHQTANTTDLRINSRVGSFFLQGSLAHNGLQLTNAQK